MLFPAADDYYGSDQGDAHEQSQDRAHWEKCSARSGQKLSQKSAAGGEHDKGAVEAAKFLAGREPGFYTMSDVLS